MELVLACADASDGSCSYVTNKILPITLTELTGNEEITDVEKGEVLEDFRRFIAVVASRNLLTNYASDSCIIQIQNELVKILLTSQATQLLAVTWKVIEVMPNVLNDDNRQIVYKNLHDALTTITPEQADCLLSFAKVFPEDVNEQVLSTYMQQSFTDPDEAKNIFTALAKLLVVTELRDHILEVFCLNIFNNKSTAIQLVALGVVKENLHGDIPAVLFKDWCVVVKLMDLIKNGTDQDVMYQASLVMSRVVRTLPNEQQIALVDKYLPHMKLNESISDLYVTSGLLAFLDPEVPMEAHFDKLVNELTKLAMSSEDETARRLANQLLCSLFNRAPIDDKHRKILRKLYELLKDEVKKGNHKAVEVLGWISKGLLARGHPDAADILETIAELLDHPKLSKAAELAFEIISLEFPELHLPLVKHLFKQKIFVLALKFVASRVEKFGEHHLTAMAHILQITPHSVLKMNLETVGPILFKCIVEGEKPHTKRVLIALKIINNFILDKSPYIFNHFQHLIKDLLRLTKFKSSMEVRIMACKCLENLTKFPLFTLVPYKNDVTHDLEAAIDDCKRLVRSAGVAARMAWFLLGEEEAKSAK